MNAEIALIVIAGIEEIIKAATAHSAGQDTATTIAQIQAATDALTTSIAKHNLAADAEEKKLYGE